MIRSPRQQHEDNETQFGPAFRGDGFMIIKNKRLKLLRIVDFMQKWRRDKMVITANSFQNFFRQIL